MKNNKYILLILSVLLIVFLSGCQTEPHIKEIGTSIPSIENLVAPGDSFKMFISIKNPLTVPFTPYIEVEFDTDNFKAKTYQINRGDRLGLEPIDALSEKSYFLIFEVNNEAEYDKYPFIISIYGDDNTKDFLGTRETETITILSIIV